MNGKRFIAMGLTMALGISAAACGKKEALEEAGKPAVEVENPAVGELAVDTSYIGTVSPQEQVYVIPKVSGTVTETFREVGDAVQAGDVLFKIDDEAYQLQLANAEAAYGYAQAGVAAQNGGARDAQNYQTERQIELLKKSLWQADDDIDEMEDTLGDLRDQGSALAAQKQKLLAAIDAAGTLEEKAKAQAAYEQVLAAINSIEATKTQLKSGIDQLENGQDTIRDNLTTAEQAYAITQNEIYPQSDAVSAAQLRQASVGIDSAKLQVGYCTVTAPISGTVESVSVEKNGMAAAGNVAYIISNKDSMKITFNVAEQAKNTLAVGDAVTAERDGRTYEGVITQIGTMTNPQTRLFEVEATVSGAGDSLPNGVSVKVYATTQKENNKLIIPYDSIYFSAGDAYVYCVEDGVIAKTEVTVGLMNETQAVIEEGLTEDSLVVKNWSSKLRSGVEVDIVSINGEAVVTAEDTDGGAEVQTDNETAADETDMTEEAE